MITCIRNLAGHFTKTLNTLTKTINAPLILHPFKNLCFPVTVTNVTLDQLQIHNTLVPSEEKNTVFIF